MRISHGGRTGYDKYAVHVGPLGVSLHIDWRRDRRGHLHRDITLWIWYGSNAKVIRP